jgi:hypothetical protein
MRNEIWTRNIGATVKFQAKNTAVTKELAMKTARELSCLV